MAASVPTQWLGFGLAFGLSATALASHKDPAFDKLSCSLKRSCKFNVDALIDQRDPLSSRWQRVKIERDGHGRVRKSVLQPLQMQGVESVDDGVRWITVLPDEGVVLDQESPLKKGSDDAQRMRLAKRNYTFRLEGVCQVAGREAVRIVATPVHPFVDGKRYFLDSDNSYPLKLESLRGGQTTVEFVTLDVSYPKRIDGSIFELSPAAGMRTIRYERPQSVPSPASARKQLGFTPILPTELPLGFEVQETQIDDSPTWRSLVLRLTDGLARATVYEYGIAGGAVKVRAFANSTDREVGGIKILVVSEMREEARDQILDRFAELAGATPEPEFKLAKVFGGTTELPAPPTAFQKIERSFGTGKSHSIIKSVRPRTTVQIQGLSER